MKETAAMFLPDEWWLVLLGGLPWQRAEQNNMQVQQENEGHKDSDHNAGLLIC